MVHAKAYEIFCPVLFAAYEARLTIFNNEFWKDI